MGIAYLPDFAIGRQLREGVLVTVLDDFTDRSGPLRILWPSSRHLAPKLRVFVDFLAANLVPAVQGEADVAGDNRNKLLSRIDLHPLPSHGRGEVNVPGRGIPAGNADREPAGAGAEFGFALRQRAEGIGSGELRDGDGRPTLSRS